MPTIAHVGPYRIFFVSVDYREPAHVHVQRERKVAKFWLDPVVLQSAGGFKPRELNQIAKLIQEHQDEFLQNWQDFFGS